VRVLYVVYLTRRTGEGVRSKVAAQAGAWEQRGNDVTVFCLTPDGSLPDARVRVFRSGHLARRVGATLALSAAAARTQADLVYLRYDLFFPPPLLGFRRPVVLELNTDDRAEFTPRGRAVALYNSLNRRVTHATADGAVFVAHELAASQSFGRAPALRTVIGNGIDLSAVTPTPAPANERPRFAFVGSDTRWAGVDKVLRLAKALPDCDFELAGVDADTLGSVPENVVLHGMLARRELPDLMRRCDVGLGTLALHRAGLNESSSLKVREYLAHGLPTVIANSDTDFRDAPRWFLLRLPNDEDNVARCADRVREFAESVRGRRVAREEVAHLDLNEKERKRLEFFARVAAQTVDVMPKRRRR
jgi:glycosyltransferase involved in cell wall biosynthesis